MINIKRVSFRLDNTIELDTMVDLKKISTAIHKPIMTIKKSKVMRAGIEGDQLFDSYFVYDEGMFFLFNEIIKEEAKLEG